MICPFCNKEIPDHSQFCPECGQRVDQDNGNKGESASYWNTVEKEAERDNKIRAEAEKKIQQKKQQTKHTVIGLLICAVATVVFICYMTIIKPAQQYNSASNLFNEGQYQAALQTYDNLGSYKDSASKADLCRENIKEQDYQAAITLFKSNNYSEALPMFRELFNYKESSDYIGKCEIALISSADVKDTITLGQYNEISIEWIVLSKDSHSALLASKYYITSKIANENESGKYGKYLCWSGSTLRKWLNTDFIKEAFPSSVSELLISNSIQTDEYDVQHYDGWDEKEITVTTEDKVYIPCKSDVEQFNLKPTSLMGRSSDSIITGWLRDRGHGIAFQVSYEPDGSYGSEWHFYSSYGIRPIIRISLDGSITSSDTGGITLEEIEEKNDEVKNDLNDSPFSQKYWVIFTEGYRDDRVEASTIDSSLSAEQLSIIWDSSLELNDTSGSEGCDQYYLDENGEWVYIGNYYRLTDNATNVLASNLDIVNQNGDVIITGIPYAKIDWSEIERYR